MHRHESISGLPRSTATTIHPFAQYAKVTLLEILPCQCRIVERSGEKSFFLEKSFFWFCRTWTKRYLITSLILRVSHTLMASTISVLTLSPPIGNLDPVDDRGSAGEGASSAILFLRMVRWCIRLTRLTLVCEVIRHRLVQVRQNQKKDFSGWRPTSAFLYLFLFHSLLRLSSFLSQYKKWILRVSHTLMASTISVLG